MCNDLDKNTAKRNYRRTPASQRSSQACFIHSTRMSMRPSETVTQEISTSSSREPQYQPKFEDASHTNTKRPETVTNVTRPRNNFIQEKSFRIFLVISLFVMSLILFHLLGASRLLFRLARLYFLQFTPFVQSFRPA